ncbi:hypothetical protein [Rhizobium sp. 1399]|jgi:hypothetical protein|uniref:hypothetical protein n=1 Tax=Rhizobium sp. 1399 TaxID=2817758 RepID=UPI0028549DDE|nr:hypothetical protein [Rhizobium sp. 1399]
MRNQSKTTRPQSRHWTAIGLTVAAAATLAAQSASAADDAATQAYHTALTNHVPGFITAPGQTDYLFVLVIVLILVMILAIGNFYFQLHAVPERIAHRANKAQLEIVAVLALISLFTHNHLYWIIGLLLAMIRIPDFSTPLYSIARSIARLASRDPEAAITAAAPNHTAPNHAATSHAISTAAAPPPVANPPATHAPVAGAPIAPVPAAAHPQPVQPAVKPGAQEEGI